MFTVNTKKDKLIALRDEVQLLYMNLTAYTLFGTAEYLSIANAGLIKLGAHLDVGGGSRPGKDGKDGVGLPDGFSYQRSPTGKLQLLQGKVVISEQDAKGTWLRTGLTTGVGSIHLEDAVSMGAAGAGVAFVNHETRAVWTPLWQGIKADGTDVYPATWRGYTSPLVNVQSGSALYTSVDCDFPHTFVDNICAFSMQFLPAEAYADALFCTITGTTGIEMARIKVEGCSTRVVLDIPVAYPMWARSGDVRRIRIEKADGTVLRTFAGAAASAQPWWAVSMRKWKHCALQVRAWDHTAMYCAGEQVIYNGLVYTFNSLVPPQGIDVVFPYGSSTPVLQVPFTWGGVYDQMAVYPKDTLVSDGRSVYRARVSILAGVKPTGTGSQAQQWLRVDGSLVDEPKPSVFVGANNLEQSVFRDTGWLRVDYNGYPYNMNWDNAWVTSIKGYSAPVSGWYMINATCEHESLLSSATTQRIDLVVRVAGVTQIQDSLMLAGGNRVGVLKCSGPVYMRAEVDILTVDTRAPDNTDSSYQNRIRVAKGTSLAITYIGA